MTHHTRFALSTFLLLSCFPGLSFASDLKPNVIIVMVDDLGYRDVGCYGCVDFETPNIDALADKGIRCTSGYVSHPYCSPSRAGLLSGKYQQSFGHEHNPPYDESNNAIGIDANTRLLPDLLKEAGYATGLIGKWHLGAGEPFRPHSRGFTKFYGFLGGGHHYFKINQKSNKSYDSPMWLNDQLTEDKLTYLTDDLTGQAVSFIDENKDNSFCLLVMYNAPHAPDHVTDEYMARVENIKHTGRRKYAALVQGLDEGVKHISAKLDELQLRKNTLFVFVSDNGGRKGVSDNRPLRGNKGWLHEGGVRVPFIVSQPGTLAEGVTFDKPVSALDLLPTALSQAKISIPADVDGVDLFPWLTGTKAGSPHEELYWRVSGGTGYAVRKGNWKLVKDIAMDDAKLYDLAEDLAEDHDLAESYPEVASELNSLYKSWASKLETPRWVEEHTQNTTSERLKAKEQGTRQFPMAWVQDGSGEKPIQQATDEFRYEEDWDSIRSRYECPKWFRDAKFGIFVFWGPASVPQVGNDKYGAWMYTKNYAPAGVSVRKYHEKHFGHQSKFGYKDFFPRFKMENYDPEAWVSLFEESGARYIVPVAEMHDGYAMYASKHTRWNVVDVGPKRDVMRMLVDEAKKKDFKVGLSSHYALNREFYPKWDPSFDTNDPKYYDLYWKPVKKEDPPTQEFLDHWWDRTTDIVEQYEPDILWFDFGLDKPGFTPVHKKIMAYYYNKGLEWNKPVVFQDKNMKNESFPEDLMVLDIERGRRSEPSEHPWQTDTAVGKISWTWVINENYKTSDFLIDELVDIVSKNGNLLLSIGPKPDGTIGDKEAAILRDFGAWLKLNGEAIYGTRPWKVYGEGPAKFAMGETKFKNKHHTEYNDVESVAADIRFTAKGDVLYATSLAWPEDGTFHIKTLRKGNPHESRAIASIDFLSGSGSIDWNQTEDALVVKTDGKKPCEAAYAFRIQFENK